MGWQSCFNFEGLVLLVGEWAFRTVVLQGYQGIGWIDVKEGPISQSEGRGDSRTRAKFTLIPGIPGKEGDGRAHLIGLFQLYDSLSQLRAVTCA